jgi:hypothetical protein
MAQLWRRIPRQRPQCGCLGCLGSLAVAVVAPVIVYVLIAPWTFHIGARWTPLIRWDGVGRLQDSAGVQYGLYIRLSPYVNIDLRNDQMSNCCELSGNAQVCTAGGAKYRFTLSGGVSGTWLHTDGSKVSLNLMESGRPKLPRKFNLSGVWCGSNLVLDDQKSMFIHFLPGGKLTPNSFSTIRVPDRHASVTVSWGSLSDCESICVSVGNSTLDSIHGRSPFLGVDLQAATLYLTK